MNDDKIIELGTAIKQHRQAVEDLQRAEHEHEENARRLVANRDKLAAKVERLKAETTAPTTAATPAATAAPDTSVEGLRKKLDPAPAAPPRDRATTPADAIK